MGATTTIRTPDQRLRVFVSSTLEELAAERRAVRRGVERLRLSPVMFELGARPHAPRQLYRAYLDQSQVFIGVYWQRYGWVAPGENVSGLEDEYRLAGDRPQLIYIKEPAPEREPRLDALLDDVRAQDRVSYRRFATADELEELVADDLAVLLSELFDAAWAGTASSLSAPPVPLTPTIGRDAEVAAVERLLHDGTRLITLTGAGGVGKTRLALEAARVTCDLFGDAVHFVALADIATASLVMSTIAGHLGVQLGAARSPLDAVAAHFGERRALLVLDNLEQVVDVGADLASLLGLASGLHVLATSRQALRVRGEREIAVAPLTVPSRDGVGAIGDSPAVQMFVDRVRAVDPTFALTADNAEAVAELCRRLEGLPLALELAAGHVRLLNPRELLRRLGSVLDLRSRAADVPPRQRTLRATLDWSHGLLDERERALFARVGVFAGGATLAAIEQVCGDDDADVSVTLAGLLDKGLVVAGDDEHSAEPRLRMLAPVREYALERLDERGESARVRHRHLDYVSRLARRASALLSGPEQREWAARLDAERANMRAAVATGMEIGAIGAVLALAWDTFVYYYIRDAAHEPREWIVRLAQHRDDLDDRQRAMLDIGLAVGGVLPADDDPGPRLRAAVEVLDRYGDCLEPAVGWHYLGLQRWQTGDVEGAITALERSSRGYDAIGHDWGMASAEMTLGLVRAATDQRDLAIEHYRRSLRHARASDNDTQVALAQQGLALIYALAGRLSHAADALDESARIVLADRWATGTSYCLEALAAIAVARDAAEDAARFIGAAHAVRQRFGIPEWTAASAVAAPVTDAARATLGDDRFAALWDNGAQVDPFALLHDGVQRINAAQRAPDE